MIPFEVGIIMLNCNENGKYLVSSVGLNDVEFQSEIQVLKLGSCIFSKIAPVGETY